MFSGIKGNKEDTYKMVIESKDEVIIKLHNELDNANDKIKNIDNILKKYQINGYNMLTFILDDYVNIKNNCICKCNKKDLSFENICDIPSPEQTEDELVLLENNNNSNKINIYENPEFVKLKEERDKLLNNEQLVYDNISKDKDEEYKEKINGLEDAIYNIRYNNKELIDNLNKKNNALKEQLEIMKKQHSEELEKLNKKEDLLPTPTNSNENKNRLEKSKNKFDNKKLNILERCNVKVYNYDNLECNNEELNILDYISSENKILIRFYSSITEKFDKNDETIWKKIYKFKVNNGEIVDYPDNKKRFKYKYLRCKELYNKYGENLKRFNMSIYYLGRLNKDEWKVFLEEFDKLYNNTFKNMESCQYNYKNGKICGIYNCNIKHRENK